VKLKSTGTSTDAAKHSGQPGDGTSVPPSAGAFCTKRTFETTA
jgi:hypothetical protein